MMKKNQADIKQLAYWAGEKQLIPVIDSEYQFSQEGVQQAFDRLKSRRAVGKIVINLK